MTDEAAFNLYGAEIIERHMGRPAIMTQWGIPQRQAERLARRAKHPEGVIPVAVSPPRGRTHLVIPDAHAEPDEDLRRFVWLGRLAAACRPDVIVCLGDWADMPSLSSYDRGKRSFEGRRYVRDIEAANEALRLFHAQLPKNYKPELVITLGNHEDRINRASNDASEFEGLIGPNDLDFQKRGWRTIPYWQSVEIDGVHYSHNVPSGIMNRPVGGVNIGRALVQKRYVSTTVGHAHVLSFHAETAGDGRKVYGLCAGCYFERDHSFAGHANKLYWRGVVMKHDVCGGQYDVSFISLERIQKHYGK